jgi:hypothetical protein
MPPFIDFISILADDTPNFGQAKIPLASLLENFALKVSDNKPTLLYHTARLLGLFISKGHSTLTKDSFGDRKTAYNIISSFCEGLIAQIAKKPGKVTEEDTHQAKKTLISWLYLSYCYTQKNLYSMPKEILVAVDEKFDFDGSQRFDLTDLILKISAVVNSPADNILKEFDIIMKEFELEEDLDSLIRYLFLHDLNKRLLPIHHCNEIAKLESKMETNQYIKYLASTLNMRTDEFLGLIAILKDDIQNSEPFIKLMLKTMGLSKKGVKEIINVLSIVLSEKEEVLLKAAKELNLQNVEFLLMGKRLLDPSVIPSIRFYDIGLDDFKIENKKYGIIGKSYDDFNDWLRSIEKNLKENLDQRRNEYQNDFDEKEIEHLEKRFACIKEYLKDQRSSIFTKQSIENMILAFSD